jgi:sec-independent protein translocase protein TatA
VGIVAVLLFGSRLPSVARSLGKSMMEFKKGMVDIQDEVRGATSVSSRPSANRYHEIDDRDEATAPKFEPPAAEPKIEESSDARSTESAPA